MASAITSDPISGQQTAFARLTAASGQAPFGDKYELYLRCKDGKTEAYIKWGQFVDTEAHTVETRIGSHPADSRTWSNSTDYQSSFWIGDATDFIQSMFGETEFVARTTPYGANTATGTFDITGVENAVANVRQACNW